MGKAAAVARRFLIAGFALGMTGCSAAPDAPNGCIAYSPAIPLLMSAGRACAVQLDEHWAVTAKHARDVMVFSNAVVDKVVDPDYDIAFFRHEGKAPQWGDAWPGEMVTAEGNPGGVLDYLVALPVPLREQATGHVIMMWRLCGMAMMPTICTSVIAYSGQVKPGYSGGPLIGDDGKVIGMTIATLEKRVSTRDRSVPVELPAGTGIALPTTVIWMEFRRLVPTDTNSATTP